MKLFLLYLIISIFLSTTPRAAFPQTPTKGCILLTFKGYNCDVAILDKKYKYSAALLSDSDKITIQKHLVNLFKQWDVTITTDDSLYYAQDKYHRIRCVITSDTLWLIKMGIFSFSVDEIDGTCHAVNSIAKGDTSGVVISTADLHSLKLITYCIAHEVGHALGINHHVDLNPDGSILNEYSKESIDGKGPIMGYLYGFDHATWCVGYDFNCNLQNDREIISRTFRPLSYEELLLEDQIW
jgi:hypothetical protein